MRTAVRCLHVSRRALVCLVCARTHPCVLAQDWVCTHTPVCACTGLGVHTHIAHVCACMCAHWCVRSGARVSPCAPVRAHTSLCVSACILCARRSVCVHTCAYLCASLSPCTRVPRCLCAHGVSDRALSLRPSSCRNPSPPSCAPCSRGCCSETSTGGWAAWGAGESWQARWAPAPCPGLGWKAGREGRVCWCSTPAPGLQPGASSAHPTSLPRAQEVKEEPFFKGLDWQMVFLQKVRGTMPGHEKGYGGTGSHPSKTPFLPAVPPAPDPTPRRGECGRRLRHWLLR